MMKTTSPNVNLMVVIAANLMLTVGGTGTATLATASNNQA
eukprot:14928.XXX_1296988_1296809_1 [CDS] Oithona nana genome sequencing.